MLTDKKVISNEHFLLRDNKLLINNAVKHLTGYYSCVVEFVNSGAKLETPQELINIVGEYPDTPYARCIRRVKLPIKKVPRALLKASN